MYHDDGINTLYMYFFFNLFCNFDTLTQTHAQAKAINMGTFHPASDEIGRQKRCSVLHWWPTLKVK